MEKILVQRRDHDCSENRLLDHIEKYLNKYSSKHLYYAQSTSLHNHKNGYILKVKEYHKVGDCVTNKHIDYFFGRQIYMKEIIRTFKIKDLVGKINENIIK